MKRLVTLGAAGALLALLVLVAVTIRPRGAASTRASTEADAAAGAPIRLPAGARGKNPITTVLVQRTALAPDLDLVGSATYDGDRVAIVGPLVAGRVITLRARPGDLVRAGQVLAEIESPEAGQAGAAYLTAQAHTRLSEANRKRERELAERNVSSVREREMAEAQAEADDAGLHAAEQRLMALGLGPAEIKALAEGRGRAGRVALRSPLAGMVLQRSITVGQAVEAHTDAFRVADLSHLWVYLDLFEKDLEYVRVGQRAELRTVSLPGVMFPSVVAFVEPRIDDATRSARVRIEFENRGQRLRPGQFVTAHLHGLASDATEPVLAVPATAVVTIEGRTAVFVEGEGGAYLRRQVDLGRPSGDLVEVRSGVGAGERVVERGAFLLKSEQAR